MTVKDRQCLLTYLKCSSGTSYYTGDVDGLYGRLTRKAIEDFQYDFGGLKVTGEADADTDQAMRHAVAYGIPGRDHTNTDENVADNNVGASFWDEIEFWDREEFRCRCGGKYCDGFPAEPDETLVRLVNDLRKQAGRPAHPSSGLRCETWNVIQNGEKNSKHKRGKALDFFVEGVSGNQLLAMAQADPRTSYAYIIDGQYVHVDVK